MKNGVSRCPSATVFLNQACEKDVKKPALKQAFSHHKQAGTRPASRSEVVLQTEAEAFADLGAATLTWRTSQPSGADPPQPCNEQRLSTDVKKPTALMQRVFSYLNRLRPVQDQNVWRMPMP
jgi:hypothetical protein